MPVDRIPMTREGYDKLRAELDRMQGAEMIEVTKRVATARAPLDTSPTISGTLPSGHRLVVTEAEIAGSGEDPQSGSLRVEASVEDEQGRSSAALALQAVKTFRVMAELALDEDRERRAASEWQQELLTRERQIVIDWKLTVPLHTTAR